MNITMAKRDDILRREQAYKDARNQQAAEVIEWYKARRSVYDSLQDLIRSKIGNTSLDLDICADTSYGDVVEVRINNVTDPHDSQYLNWKWTASMKDNGDIKKESGSWSSLSATTSEQISNLKESIRVIEILNNLDWNKLLTVELPKYEDYVNTEIPERENFEEQLLEADVEDAAEQGLLIKGHSDKFSTMAVMFYKVLEVNPKSFRVRAIPEYNLGDESRWGEPFTIQKQEFYNLIEDPVKTVEV